MKKCLLFLVLLLVIVLTLYAAFSSTEEFNYSNGNLNGQSGGTGWTGNWADVDNRWITTSTTPAGGQGGSSVKNTTADTANAATRPFTAITAGIVSWEMRTSITNPTDNLAGVLRDGTTSRMYVRFGPTGNIEIFDNGTYRAITTYSANTWYRIAIEFDDAAQPDKYRAQVNGGPLSPWMTVNGGTYTNISQFRMAADATGTRDFWIDDIRTTTITPLTSVVTFDAATSSVTNPPSFTHVNGSSSANDIIFCECKYNHATNSISAMTYGGVSMAAVQTRQTPGNNNYQEWWYVKNPAGGSNALQATLSGAMSWIQCTAYTYNNVDQTTPLGTAVKATALATSVAVTATSAVGELVVDVTVVFAGGAPAITVGSQQTQRFNYSPTTDARSLGSDEYGTTNVAMGGSWTGTQYGAVMAVSLKPSAVSAVPIISILSNQWRQRRQ